MTDKEAKVRGLIQARKMEKRLQDYAIPLWYADAFGISTSIFAPPPNWFRRWLAAWMFAFIYYHSDKLSPLWQHRIVYAAHVVAGCLP